MPLIVEYQSYSFTAYFFGNLPVSTDTTMQAIDDE
jgi:hypothetical protein